MAHMAGSSELGGPGAVPPGRSASAVDRRGTPRSALGRRDAQLRVGPRSGQLSPSDGLNNRSFDPEGMYQPCSRSRSSRPPSRYRFSPDRRIESRVVAVLRDCGTDADIGASCEACSAVCAKRCQSNRQALRSPWAGHDQHTPRRGRNIRQPYWLATSSRRSRTVRERLAHRLPFAPPFSRSEQGICVMGVASS